MEKTAGERQQQQQQQRRQPRVSSNSRIQMIRLSCILCLNRSHRSFILLSSHSASDRTVRERERERERERREEASSRSSQVVRQRRLVHSRSQCGTGERTGLTVTATVAAAGVKKAVGE